jgi:hypothetical protein
VALFARPDGTFGSRTSAATEDMGAWTAVADYSGESFASQSEAIAAVRNAVSWLAGVLDS